MSIYFHSEAGKEYPISGLMGVDHTKTNRSILHFSTFEKCFSFLCEIAKLSATDHLIFTGWRYSTVNEPRHVKLSYASLTPSSKPPLDWLLDQYKWKGNLAEGEKPYAFPNRETLNQGNPKAWSLFSISQKDRKSTIDPYGEESLHPPNVPPAPRSLVSPPSVIKFSWTGSGLDERKENLSCRKRKLDESNTPKK